MQLLVPLGQPPLETEIEPRLGRAISVRAERFPIACTQVPPASLASSLRS